MGEVLKNTNISGMEALIECKKTGYHNQEQVAFEIHLVQTIRPAFLVGSFQKNPQSGFSHVGRLSFKKKKKKKSR